MNTPTKITFSRIIAIVLMIITLVVFYFIGVANPSFKIPNIPGTSINWLYFGLFIFFVLASFTDFLDGHLARKNNQVTDLGKFLDPVADKLLVNSMVIFLIVPASYTDGQMSFSLWCALLLVARDIIVDALRFIAAQKGVVIAANIFGKAKTVLEMVAVSLVLLNGWPFSYFDTSWGNGFLTVANIAVYLCTIASVVSGAIYMAKYGHVLLGKKDESGASK